MKIAFFSDNFYPELSGIADSIMASGSELASRGHEIHFFVPYYPKRSYALTGALKNVSVPPNVHVHRLVSLPFKAPTLQGRMVIPDVLLPFLHQDFDIIHSHSFFGAGIDALCFAGLKGVPFIGTNHTLIESFVQYSPIRSGTMSKTIKKALKGYLSWYYNKCAHVTAPSGFLIKDMQASGFKAAASVISNPIEDMFFRAYGKDKNKMKHELGLGDLSLLYIGRLSEEKNVSILLEAFITFAKDNPNSSLTLIGQGALRTKLEETARESGIESRIKIVGPFVGDKKNRLCDYIQASDIFVMPSTSETQSMCVLQAMAGGLPIIAARAAALPEIVTSERGLLFEPESKEGLIETLNKLAADASLRTELGEKGRMYATSFSATAIADAWESLYTSVINNRHGAGKKQS